MILTPIASTTSVLFKCYERADIISILILPSTTHIPKLIHEWYLTSKAKEIHECCIQVRNKAISFCDI